MMSFMLIFLKKCHWEKILKIGNLKNPPGKMIFVRFLVHPGIQPL